MKVEPADQQETTQFHLVHPCSTFVIVEAAGLKIERRVWMKLSAPNASKAVNLWSGELMEVEPMTEVIKKEFKAVEVKQ